MISRRYDVPLDKDTSTRYLPWIIAFMVYLAILALTAVMAVSAMLSQWDQAVSGTLTVQILPTSENPQPALSSRQVEIALQVLRAEPGVIAAEPLQQEEISGLLQPWLGAGALSGELPIPALIDVAVDPAVELDLEGIERRLVGAVPNAVLDDHKVWLSDLVTFARSIEIVSLLVVGLVATAGVFIVVFATRSGVAIHQHVIEVLHHIGAQDAYIARQFQTHALGLGLKGGLIGLLLAGLTLLGMVLLSGEIDSPLMPKLSFSPLQIGTLLFVPIAAAGITMLTARITVMRNLLRML